MADYANILKTGTEYLRKAVEYDQKGDFSSALKYYTLAAEALMKVYNGWFLFTFLFRK